MLGLWTSLAKLTDDHLCACKNVSCHCKSWASVGRAVNILSHELLTWLIQDPINIPWVWLGKYHAERTSVFQSSQETESSRNCKISISSLEIPCNFIWKRFDFLSNSSVYEVYMYCNDVHIYEIMKQSWEKRILLWKIEIPLGYSPENCLGSGNPGTITQLISINIEMTPRVWIS